MTLRGSRRSAPTALLALVLALPLLLLPAGTAAAAPGSALLGHRCRVYDAATTNENTVLALAEVSAIRGIACEVDVWTLRDGTPVVWHDSTWGRVADHDTLPRAVAPTDRVTDSSWRQARGVRTKGGERVALLRRMIDASAAYDVPLVVEIRNSLPDPARWLDYAASVGAEVSWYQKPYGTGCATGQVDALHAAGVALGVPAVVGLKMPVPRDACQRRWWAAWLHRKGVSFVTESAPKVTREFVEVMRSQGIEVYARGVTSETSRRMLRRGAVRIFANHPDHAVHWPS